METTELQQQLFSYLKGSIPPHLSLIDELGELLDLSADSVYRRIRGEKPITLSELKTICEYYHLSLDQLLQLENDTVAFRAPDLAKKNVPFIDVLRSMLRQLKYFNSFKQRHMLYLCKDMPIWQFYLFPELAAFKTFVWAKSINNEQAYEGKVFSLAEFPFNDCYEVGREIIQEYNNMPSIELWNEESINSTISQIRFYKDSGGFRSAKDVEFVINSFESTIDHLKLQAEKGVKFLPKDPEILYKQTVQVYVNEIVIGSNTILVELDENRISFIPYNVFNFILTREKRFNESVFDGFNILKSRSTLISGTGEKERNRFFRVLKENINKLRS